jgi:hypothetical protein
MQDILLKEKYLLNTERYFCSHEGPGEILQVFNKGRGLRWSVRDVTTCWTAEKYPSIISWHVIHTLFKHRGPIFSLYHNGLAVKMKNVRSYCCRTTTITLYHCCSPFIIISMVARNFYDVYIPNELLAVHLLHPRIYDQ